MPLPFAGLFGGKSKKSAATSQPKALQSLNTMSKGGFNRHLAGVFENSPWVVERAAPLRPFSSVGVLHDVLTAIVTQASEEQQLELLRAHPDLAGKAARAGDVTEQSAGEQAGAGLSALTDEEYEKFDRLNTDYREKFGFPFIIAVRGLQKQDILRAFEYRLPNTPTMERRTALEQVCKIARIRLADLVIDTQGPMG